MSVMDGKTWQEHRTHCKNGHEFTGDNVRLYKAPGYDEPYRVCRTCVREQAEKGRRRKRPIAFTRRHVQVALDLPAPPVSLAARRRRNKARARTFVDALKVMPCTDCGGRFHPVAMDFDHLPEHEKRGGISDMVERGRSNAAILREIAKCQLVCSNCHRVRTHSRTGKRDGLPQDER